MPKSDDHNKENLIKICQDLIQINSVNPPGNENSMIDYCAQILSMSGAKIKIIKHTESRSSLIATWRGEDPDKEILFVGHVDTVPCGDENKWKANPLSGEVIENRIYGRGSSDMKGGVAVLLQALKLLKEKQPKNTVVLALTADEESDGIGAKSLLDSDLHLSPDVVFIPEPTNNHIAVAEKGTLWFDITALGKSAHASMPELGSNAVNKMAKVIHEMDFSPLMQKNHALLGGFTASFTRIEGGQKTNIIPDSCRAEMDIRYLPAQTSEEIREFIKEQIRSISGIDNISDEFLFHTSIDKAAIESDCSLPIMKEAIQLIEDKYNGAEVIGVPYFTDAGDLVPYYKAPFVICGPGDPDLAHTVNEYISIDKLYESFQIYSQLLENLAFR